MSWQKVILFIFILLGIEHANAQSQPLKLDDAIESAMENNRQMQLAQNQEQEAKARYQQTDAFFLPQIGISYTALTTNNPLNAFGFKLQQAGISQNDFQPELLNHPGNTTNFSTQALLQQPIFNPDLIYQRKAAKAQIAISGLQKQRTQDGVRLQTESGFMQLQLDYQVVKVLEEALLTGKAAYKFTEDRFKAGYLSKADLLNAEVQVKSIETQLTSAQNEIKNQSDNLSLLMGKPAGTIYSVDSLALLATPESIQLPENRSDFEAIQQAKQSYDLNIKGTKMELVPKINGFAGYQLNDPKLIGFHNGSYLAGIQLTWNIFQGTKVQSTVSAQRIQQQKLDIQLAQMKEKDQNELRTAKRNLLNTNFQISQAKTSISQAREALTIIENRYRQGLTGTTDILRAQSQLSQQKLAYQQAVFMHNLTVVYINFLTTTH